jgi:hypothetical protein
MRKCQVCEREMEPAAKCTTMICKKRLCSIDCAAAWGKQQAVTQRERQSKAEHKKARERIKTRQKWLSEAQAAVNAYVRKRDEGKPCISCDKPDDGTHQRHASHYRSVKACSILRFDPRNIFASCAQCNSYLSGNLLEFRIRLTRRYGTEYVEWLEAQNGIRRYEIDELKAIKEDYKLKLKLLQVTKGAIAV